MEQVRRGLMTMEEAENSKMQNLIVRSLGVEESVEPDLEDHEFRPNDVLLLCSDGLSRFVTDSMMLEVVSRSSDLDVACTELIEAAKTAGSDDNITCVLIRAAEPSLAARMLDTLLSGKLRHKRQNST
jgi:protein phosphatase